jgi:hypothetical protein
MVGGERELNRRFQRAANAEGVQVCLVFLKSRQR